MDKVIDVDFYVTWPSTGQAGHAVAKRRYVDAIAKRGSPELAREAFVEAAVWARVLG
ncbi:DUF982 domain-containing protein [Rhizobium sp. SIMBA_035]